LPRRTPPEKTPQCRDPHDQMIFCRVGDGRQADFLVTDDNDLLMLAVSGADL
jgi:predicted nucleic acid-binding protein